MDNLSCHQPLPIKCVLIIDAASAQCPTHVIRDKTHKDMLIEEGNIISTMISTRYSFAITLSRSCPPCAQDRAADLVIETEGGGCNHEDLIC